MVTAKTTEVDLLRGLEDGADDYIKKPFSILELVSRVRALLRRVQADIKFLTVGPIVLNLLKRQVTVSGIPIELTFKEFELLRLLMRRLDKVVSREEINHIVWGVYSDLSSRTLDMHIRTLRHKLGRSGSIIRTIRNVGYMITSPCAQDETQD